MAQESAFNGFPELPAINNCARIIGGDDACQDDMPPIVAFTRVIDGAIEPCTGIAVADYVVLTAGHCWSPEFITKYGVAAGKVFYENRTVPQDERIQIHDAILHPDYDPSNLRNDIMVVRLKRPMNLKTYAKLVDEPLKRVGIEAKIVGWGNTAPAGEDSAWLDTLQIADAILMPDEACGRLAFWDPQKKSCTIETKTGASSNDSGGGLFVRTPLLRWAICGITSSGNDGQFGIFTRVSFYTDWINQVITEPMLLDDGLSRNLDPLFVHGLDMNNQPIGISNPNPFTPNIPNIGEIDMLDEAMRFFTNNGLFFGILLVLLFFGKRLFANIKKGLSFGSAVQESIEDTTDFAQLIYQEDFLQKMAKRFMFEEQTNELTTGQRGLESQRIATNKVVAECQKHGIECSESKALEYVKSNYGEHIFNQKPIQEQVKQKAKAQKM